MLTEKELYNLQLEYNKRWAVETKILDDWKFEAIIITDEPWLKKEPSLNMSIIREMLCFSGEEKIRDIPVMHGYLEGLVVGFMAKIEYFQDDRHTGYKGVVSLNSLNHAISDVIKAGSKLYMCPRYLVDPKYSVRIEYGEERTISIPERLSPLQPGGCMPAMKTIKKKYKNDYCDKSSLWIHPNWELRGATLDFIP
jgi:hypothetical protein